MRIVPGLAAIAACVLAIGSAYAKSDEEMAELQAKAHSTLSTMTARDPSLQPLLEKSAGYIVFPKVGEGGLIVGGAGGKGILFEHGKPSGFAKLSKVSVGAQIGGQKFAELVVIRDPTTLAKMKNGGDFDFGSKASATAIKQGAAKETSFGDDGTAVFIYGERGAMANASVGGQRITITPMTGAAP